MRRRQALVSLLLLLPLPSLGVWLGLIRWPDTALGMTAYFGCKGVVLLLPLAWLFFVYREKPSLSPVRHGGLGIGALLGAATAAVIVGAWFLVGRHFVPADNLQTYAAKQGLDVPSYLGLAVFLCLVNAPLEEYVWRWFVVRQGQQLMPTAGAIALSALGFTAHHVLVMRLYFPWGIVALAAAGIAGGAALWSWLYVRYRSVWPAYLAHLGADVAIMALGYLIIFG